MSCSRDIILRLINTVHPLIWRQITWIEFLYLEKSWPLLMSNTRFMEPLMVPNDEPKSVNIDKISTALHVYYLNLIVNYLHTVQIAQIQAYNFECTLCSDAISGSMNRVFDIKSSHDFCRHRNSIQVIYFQINESTAYLHKLSWIKMVSQSQCQRIETTKREVDRKKRKMFVTAHVILRTAAMFLARALNRGSHPSLRLLSSYPFFTRTLHARKCLNSSK